MKILLIDDDQALTAILTATLKKEGYEITEANDGVSGINRAKTEQPNIILLDQVLPDISGNEVLKEIKQDEETKNIPVLMLSNFSQEELVRQAINEGATDYIFKYQVEPSDIVNKVKDVLNEGGGIITPPGS